VDGLLSPLTNEQRQVLEMRFLDDLSIEETASRTGRSQDAVKGLQRRAINAIIAAAAILLALVALRWAGGDDADRISNAPADQTPVAEDSPPEEGAGRLDGEQTAVVVGDGEPERASGDSALVVDAEASPDAAEADPAEPVGVGPFVVTRGSSGSTEIDATGPTVPADLHGTRVYCAVSHFANGDPIAGPLDPGLNPANVYWGNTSAGATSSVQELPNTGNGSCEGGISDRSAYWMPALFDSEGQAVLPEFILVEYKTFVGPGVDRTLVREVPSGLELVADASVAKSAEDSRSASGDDSTTSFLVRFPECLATNPDGTPVLSSPDKTSHLSYSGALTANGCPETHPYRMPQITYKITYALPFDAGWRLATGFTAQSSTDGLVGGVIPGMSQVSRERVVRCTVELIDKCEFAASVDGRDLFRSQLSDRFIGPNGEVVYQNTVTFADDADRTPFGASIPQVS